MTIPADAVVVINENGAGNDHGAVVLDGEFTLEVTQGIADHDRFEINPLERWCGFDCGFIRYGEKNNVFTAELPLQLIYMRYCTQAGRTPGGPEFEDLEFPGETRVSGLVEKIFGYNKGVEGGANQPPLRNLHRRLSGKEMWNQYQGKQEKSHSEVKM